jgi:hypothetical protein
MTNYLASDDKYRGPYFGGYRFGRTHGNRIRGRTALSRVGGWVKAMIEAIANSKLRRMNRELELQGVRYGRYHPEDHYMRGPGPKWREKHRASNGGA